jgi:peptidyl-prolyl cis-trans isomerase SurA
MALAPAIVTVALLAGACRSGPPPVLPPLGDTTGLLLSRPAPPPAARNGQTSVDRVVAVVNGDAVLMSELQEAMILFQRETRAPGGAAADREELERKVLNRMIDHRLQIQEARREKIEVSDEDVRAVVDDFVRKNGGDRQQVEGQLVAQGMSWEALRRELRDQLLAQRIRSRRVSRRVQITEAEVDAYVAESRSKLEAGLKYHVRHLAVLAQPPESPAAWERAQAAVEAAAAEARGGADFAALARTRSQDPSAATGGDLGWMARGELEPLFEEPILRLKKGEVTPPIRSRVGFHLFYLEDREDLTPEMLADARAQARELLYQRRAQERLEEWMEGLRRRALIAVRL